MVGAGQRLCGSGGDVIRAGTWRKGKIYTSHLTSIQLLIMGTIGILEVAVLWS